MEDPAQYFPAEHIDDRELVVVSAFTMYPNIFYVQTQVFQRSAGLNPSVADPLTFALRLYPPATQQVAFCHQSVYLFPVDQLRHAFQFPGHYSVTVYAIVHVKNRPDLLHYKVVFHQSTTGKGMRTGLHPTGAGMCFVMKAASGNLSPPAQFLNRRFLTELHHYFLAF